MARLLKVDVTRRMATARIDAPNYEVYQAFNQGHYQGIELLFREIEKVVSEASNEENKPPKEDDDVDE